MTRRDDDELERFERIAFGRQHQDARRSRRYDTSTPPARRLVERASFRLVLLIVSHAVAAGAGALGRDCAMHITPPSAAP